MDDGQRFRALSRDDLVSFAQKRGDTMAKLQRECWKSKGWERGERLTSNEGNQAHTFLARRQSDPLSDFNYILKTLKRQEDQNRRAMFYSETTAMSSLDHPGILKVVDTNSDRYKEPEELYLVTPFVAGDDLDKLAADALPLEHCVRVTCAVLSLLNHCHERGVIHRDIKPCHVIITDRQFDKPTLIDFGLAYNESRSPDQVETQEGEGKGNRFLIGPEHMPGRGLANRSPSTDICQCIGLLYFLLTRQVPGILLDENQRKPHQRHPVRFKENVPNWQRDAIQAIFDKAFEWHPESRWANAGEVARRLAELLNGSANPESALRAKLASLVSETDLVSRTENARRGQELAGRIGQSVEEIVRTVQDECREYLTIKFQGRQGNGQISFSRPGHGHSAIAVQVKVDRDGVHVSVQPFTGGFTALQSGPVQIAKLKFDAFDLLAEVRDRLEAIILACLKEWLEK